MADDSRVRSYCVTFLNLVNRTKHEVLVSTWREASAHRVAQIGLAAHLTKTAGQIQHWVHDSTAEIGPS